MGSCEKAAPLEVPSNRWATSYACDYFNPESGRLTPDAIKLLQHVNCSYLSSGTPPTLLALKQHAHSLLNLIKVLAPSIRGCPIPELDAEEEEDSEAFYPGDAFDFLDQLDKPYTNHSESHHVPLWGLLNTVKSESEAKGIEYHCPLAAVADWGPWAEKDGLTRPFMTHHSLAMHINHGLEILDHEYSATGGLLSMLPPNPGDEETPQQAGLRNCLLGQWLAHHQYLVGRMHELEITYNNALEVLAGEAVVPHQMIRRAGPDGVSRGREIVYPQDRWVLANSGDDVLRHIHTLLDQQEATYTAKEKMWRKVGAAGDRMWDKSRGGNWYAKGLIPVDVLTRYYRIAGKGPQSPLFVLPAIETNPSAYKTRKLEQQPTVITVAAPKFPERVTELEKRYRGIQVEAEKAIEEKEKMVKAVQVKDVELLAARSKLALMEMKLPGGSAGERSSS